MFKIWIQDIFGTQCAFSVRCLYTSCDSCWEWLHKVKDIKSYLNSTVCQDSWDSLNILHNQRRVGRKLNFNDIVNYFANMEV